VAFSFPHIGALIAAEALPLEGRPSRQLVAEGPARVANFIDD
jgi:hypothetical protein